MAIASYDDLAAAIKSWAARSDSTFSARVDDFVGLHEDRMYNGSDTDPSAPLYCPALRVKEMELRVVVTMATDPNYSSGNVGYTDLSALSVPVADFRQVTRDTDLIGLDYMPPRQFDIQASVPNSSGVPGWYTVVDSQFRVTPAYIGNLNLYYYGRLPSISSNNKTGTLLTSYPLLYLSGCLFEAFSFLQEVDLAMGWFAKYKAAVAGANGAAMATRFGGGPIRVQPRQQIP
jgi:hypothetical protein